jgi:histidine ammonia-lyase
VVVETLLAMLDADVCPRIPEIGSVGASGDLVELATSRSPSWAKGTCEHDGESVRRRGDGGGAHHAARRSRAAKGWRS